MIRYLYLVFLVYICIPLALHSQADVIRCASNEYHEAQMESNADYRINYKKLLKQRKELRDNPAMRIACDGTNMISIPLAFHFEADLALSCDDQLCMLTEILDQINAMNIGFGDNTAATALDGTPLNDIADCPTAYEDGGGTSVISTGTCLDFCLAIPPAGNADGLTADDPPVTFGVYNASGISAPTWTGVVNIFVGNCGGGILGFSPLPGSANGDGICMASTSFGGPDGSAGCGLDTDATYGLGATLVHEMGHYLGLAHTWAGAGGGCGDGDGVADTPDGDNNSFGGCDGAGACVTNSCGNIQAANFMDYAVDACMGIFTEGQADVMNATALSLFGAGSGSCVANQAPTELAQCGAPAPITCPVADDLALDLLADGDLFCTNAGTVTVAAIEDAVEYLPGIEISWTGGTWGSEFESQVDDGCDGGGLLLPSGTFGVAGAASGPGSVDLAYWSPEGTITLTFTDANFADDSELEGLMIVDRLCGTVLYGPSDTGVGLTTTPLVVVIPANSLSGGVTMSGPGIIEEGCSQGFAQFDPLLAGPGTHDICIDYAGVDCDLDGDTDDLDDCPPVQQCISVTVILAPTFDLSTVDLACSADGTTYDVSVTLTYDPASTADIVLSGTGGVVAPAVLSGSGMDVLTITGVPSMTPFTIDVDDTGAADCDTGIGATFTCLDCSAETIGGVADADEFCSDDAAVALTSSITPMCIDVELLITVADGGNFAGEHVGAIVGVDALGMLDWTTVHWELNTGDAAYIEDVFVNGAAGLCDSSDPGGAGIGSADGTTASGMTCGEDFAILLYDAWGDGWGATASFTFTDQCGNLYADESYLADGCGNAVSFTGGIEQNGVFTGNGVSLISDPDAILGNGDETWEFDPALADIVSADCETSDIVYQFFDECGNFCDLRVTPFVYEAPTADDIALLEADCDADGNVTFTPVVSGGSGSYTMTYTYNDGAANVTVTDAAIGPITVPGIAANTSITVTISNTYTGACDGNDCTTDITLMLEECPEDVVLTYDPILSDPCDCNDDQSVNGAMDGTFSETIVYATDPLTTGLSFCVANGETGDAPVAGTALTDNGDGTYQITFNHTDGVGYTLAIADCADLDVALTGVIGNTCNYPIISFALATSFCSTDAVVDLSALAMETTGLAFAGAFTFSGTGVTGGNMFDPSTAVVGSNMVTALYTPTAIVGTMPGTVVGCTTELTIDVTVTVCSVLCPTATVIAGADEICTMDLATEIINWQGLVISDATNAAAIADANTDAAVSYSSLTVPGEVAAPDGIVATGIHSGLDPCATEDQLTHAYLLCYGDDGVSGTADDEYLFMGTHTLTVYPEAQEPMVTAGTDVCQVIATPLCVDLLGAATSASGGASMANWDSASGIYTALPGDLAGTVTITIASGLGAICADIEYILATPACAAICPLAAFDCPGIIADICDGTDYTAVELNPADTEPLTVATSTGSWLGTAAFAVSGGANPGDPAVIDLTLLTPGVPYTLIYVVIDMADPYDCPEDQVECDIMVTIDCAADAGNR